MPGVPSTPTVSVVIGVYNGQMSFANPEIGGEGYPRTRGFQVRRILDQVGTLPRYALSAVIRQARLAVGRDTPYEAAVPLL